VKERAERDDHYSYTVYADPNMARSFDASRFGGPIGELLAATQGRVLAEFVGDLATASILDVGTGTGRAALLLARGGGRVTGVDASEQMLAVARQRALEQHQDIAYERADAHALPFPDRAFDVAVSLRVLMHTPQWQQCVGELCRVAGRRVIIDYPSRRSAAALESAARRLASRLGVSTEAYRVFSHAQITRAFAAQGFRITAIHKQFVLPIAVHKKLHASRVTLGLERALARAGVLGWLGSPVTLVADRA
jgi:ubiquinone/menaquinone biosynthesis C-methylase UbiE